MMTDEEIMSELHRLVEELKAFGKAAKDRGISVSLREPINKDFYNSPHYRVAITFDLDKLELSKAYKTTEVIPDVY